MATVLEGAPPTVLDRRKSHADAEDERRLVRAMQDRYDEGLDCRDRWSPPKERETYLALYRGHIRPKFGRHAHYKANFIKAFIERQCAQLTDNRPIARIDSFKAGLRDVAFVLQKNIRAVWDEADMQRQTRKMCHTAAVDGSAGIATVWDFASRRIVLEILRIGQVVVDPTVTEAAKINTDAEYAFIDRIVALSQIRAAFPGRGAVVTPDMSASNLTPSDDKQPSRGKSIWTPVRRVLGGTTGQGVALERVRVRECWVKDRQMDASGERLFPSYRRILIADPNGEGIVLKDEANTYWDGEIPINWYDWSVDPNHPYGSSQVDDLMESQLAFNQIGTDTVNAKLLSNVFTFMYDTGALSPETLKRLQAIDGSLLLEKIGGPNKSIQPIPPPPTNSDSLALMRFIFTSAQLLTGVTDVTMGENPGSLQSGLAIEGLQEGANTMTRDRASRMEDLFGRVGQQLVSRTFQFWTTDRVAALNGGAVSSTLAYAKFRQGFFIRDGGSAPGEEGYKPVTNAERHLSFQDFKFTVLPGSSAPGARIRRMEAMQKLAMVGMATAEDVLEAGDMPNPAEMAERGKKEMIEKAPMLKTLQGLGNK